MSTSILPKPADETGSSKEAIVKSLRRHATLYGGLSWTTTFLAVMFLTNSLMQAVRDSSPANMNTHRADEWSAGTYFEVTLLTVGVTLALRYAAVMLRAKAFEIANR